MTNLDSDQRAQVRRDAEQEIRTALRAYGDDPFAKDAEVSLDRLLAELKQAEQREAALVEALIGEIARQMWLRDNYEDDSAWDDDHLLAATYAEYEARARAVSVDHLTVYEQSQGNG